MDRPIVVVDDEPGVLDVLREVLELEGYRVLCCDKPDQLSAMIHGTQPRLFLIDIMLPGISGIELAQQLRAEAFGQTPMIAMSASTFMVQTARSTGLFTETLGKPFDLARLLDLVARCLL